MLRHAAFSIATLVLVCSVEPIGGTAFAQRRTKSLSAEYRAGKTPGPIATWRAKRTYRKLIRGTGERGDKARLIDAKAQGKSVKLTDARAARRFTGGLSLINFGLAANQWMGATAPHAEGAALRGLATGLALSVGLDFSMKALEAGRTARSELRRLRAAPVREMTTSGVIEPGSREELAFKKAGWLP